MNEIFENTSHQPSWKLASRQEHLEDTGFQVGSHLIGAGNFSIFAGPCAVENKQQTLTIAKSIAAAGAVVFRGGAYKPRTSPYDFQGLGEEGLDLLSEAKKETGLPIITEITSVDDIEKFMDKVDIIQVGARNMQNFSLLKELGRLTIPVLLKRGHAATIEELLLSSEYILSGGNENVILCERGIRTFEPYTRNTLDISAVPVLKKLSHLPVFVDPSHAGGKFWLVEPLSKAAMAVGADGIIVEVHNDPDNAMSDGDQSLTLERFDSLMLTLKKLAPAFNKTL